MMSDMESRTRGRDCELAALGEFVGATKTSGDCGVLLLTGPAGSGKTRLLAEAAKTARRTGVRVATAEAGTAQGTVPLAALLSALLDGAVALWSAHGIARAHSLIDGLQQALETATAHHRLLIALDDLERADAETLVVLRALIARTARLPVRWAFALRPGESRVELRELLQRLDHARRIALGPLSDDAVAGIVADQLDAPGHPELLCFAARAGGNPFLLVELLQGLREERRVSLVDGQARARGSELPARLVDAMRDRLDQLGTDGCAVVRVAAVLGQRFTAGELAAVLRRRPSRLLEPIDVALGADVLAEWGNQLGFRSELVRQAVLATLTVSARRGLQRELASALIAHGSAPDQVAVHLAEGALPGDRVAIEQLRTAAGNLSASDPGAAADMSVRALELCATTSPERGAVLVETLTRLSAAMRDDEADALATSALQAPLSPTEEAEVRLLRSTRLSRPAHERAEENRRALRLPGLSPELRARHRAWLSYSLASAGLLALAGEHANRALAAGTDDSSVHALAAVARSTIAFQHGEYRSALAALDVVPGDDPIIGALVALRRIEVLAALGRLHEALRLLAHEPRPSLAGPWLAMRAHVRFLAGELAEAGTDAEAAEAAAPEGASTSHPIGAALARLQGASRTGDGARRRTALRSAWSTLADADPAARRQLACLLALTARDAGEALGRLETVFAPAGPLAPGDPALHPQVVRLALAAGQRTVAVRAAEAAEHVELVNPGNPLLAGLAAHARGLLTENARELLRAATLLGGTQRPLAHACALEDAGRLRGDVDCLAEAFELYTAAGATGPAKRTAERLRERGVRRHVAGSAPTQGWDSLTASELRVVRLVGAGATNRTAATRLHLSPHTVSTHLRHAFVKLRINSRVELARLLHEHDGPLVAR
jgi:DNA-binding CsgD family transcriptional regulator